MAEIQYEYFGIDGGRRSESMDADQAARILGGRVLTGFPMWQREVTAPDGTMCAVVAFQSNVTGSVWAVYVTESWEV